MAESQPLLTKEGIGEPVPHAAPLSDHPPPLQAGSEAERRPEHAHQDVAQVDVQQDEIDGRPQGAILDEDEENEGVAEDARHQDDTEEYSHCRVAGPAQPAGALGVPGSSGVGAKAEDGDWAVWGAEVAVAGLDDHIWGGAGVVQRVAAQ